MKTLDELKAARDAAWAELDAKRDAYAAWDAAHAAYAAALAAQNRETDA